MLFDLGERTDFSAEYAALFAALQRMDGPAAQIQRELRYRKTLVNRSRLAMFARYALFRSRNLPVMNEETTIKLHLLGRKGPQARTMSTMVAA
jgi:hypothetical protein